MIRFLFSKHKLLSAALCWKLEADCPGLSGLSVRSEPLDLLSLPPPARLLSWSQLGGQQQPALSVFKLV